MGDPLMFDGLQVELSDEPVASRDHATQTFKAMERMFHWGPEITAYITDTLVLSSKHDFVTHFRPEADGMKELRAANLRIDKKTEYAGVTLEAGAEVPRGMISKVSSAVDALLKTQKRASDLAIKGAGDRDEVLEKSDVIQGWIKRFHSRHKITIPFSQMPGDQILIKLHRQFGDKRLDKFDMLKIKALDFEKKTVESKKEIGYVFLMSQDT